MRCLIKIFLEGVDSGGDAGGEVRVAWSRGRRLETEKPAQGVVRMQKMGNSCMIDGNIN